MNFTSKLFGSVLLLISVLAFANTETEIQHLLNYVATTSCQYERNGDFHSGIDAKKHINKKYDYYKDDIHSAEDFIKYSATQSTITKKKYKIHCADSPVEYSRDWLLEELSRYRNTEEL